jgi:hypothetical protein
MGLLIVPFIKNLKELQNPFGPPVTMTIFTVGTFVIFWLGFSATMPIYKVISLDLF